jgi:two-component system, OmpR family, sensor histidine kinase ArlS
LVTIVLGFIFAGQSLKPISVMNREVSSITAYNLRKKLNEGNRQDEIAQLAINFNLMLSRLDESFALQRSFVSHASHELRTPLAALKSEIQVALESPRNTEEYQQILQSLFDDTQRLIQLTNSLLQLAQSENKTQTIKLQPIRIDELVFEVQSEIQNFHRGYGIDIDFDDIPEQEQSVMVQGNEALLKTLFSNLMDNACKYSSNKRAKVQIGFDNTHCKIRVIDTGIGIPTSDLTRIFEPLYRAENARTFRGSGIGLSVCKRIVDLHQGHIEVASIEGQGTTFTVLLAHL